jgi:branched-chain amino acid aminotransferase
MFEVGKDVGIDVREEVLHPTDLETADEMFLTSTTRELSPVVKVDNRVVGSGKPGPVTQALLAGYRKRAQDLTRTPQPAGTNT